MADISAEIAAFKNAVYGEDVRDAMVSLANKVNNESSAATAKVDEYDTRLSAVEADGYVTTAKLADGGVTDAKLVQSGGVLEKVDAIAKNKELLFLKDDIRIGSLQAGGNVGNEKFCFTQKFKLPVTGGENVLIRPAVLTDVHGMRIRIVMYTNEELDGTAGTMTVTFAPISDEMYTYAIPDNQGYNYMLFCIYYYYDSSYEQPYNDIMDEFSDSDIICTFTYLNRYVEYATHEQLDDAVNSVENDIDLLSNDVNEFSDSISVEKSASGEKMLFFTPLPTTKIEALTECVFTGRNIIDIYGMLGTLYPTIDNTIPSRHFWGSSSPQVDEVLNTLPAGTYTFSIGFLLSDLRESYDGETTQETYLMLSTNVGGRSGQHVDITSYATGSIAIASLTVEITEAMVGNINHLYLYCPYTGAADKTKWKVRIAFAQVEFGENATGYKPYRSVVGTSVTAYDGKMSAASSGNISLTYREFAVPLGEQDYELPSYFATEVADCVAKLESYCTEKSLVYAIVTDSHVHNDTTPKTTRQRWSETVRNIKAVHEDYQIDSLVHLGDMVNGSLPRSQTEAIIKQIRDDMRGIVQPNFILVGNHDTNTFYGSSMDEPITEAQMYGLWERYNEKDVTARPAALPYWYKDYDSFGIRVIFLSSSMGDGTHGGQGTNWGYPEAERNWFRDVALDTDYQVLMLSHMPFTQGFISDASTLPAYGDEMIATAAAFINNGGTIIGLVNGHTHFDYHFNNGNFHESSLGCECITNNTVDLHGADAYTHAPESAVRYGRIDDTVTQDLWSILVVRPTSRTCKIIRFGAGEDIEWSY